MPFISEIFINEDFLPFANVAVHEDGEDPRYIDFAENFLEAAAFEETETTNNPAYAKST